MSTVELATRVGVSDSRAGRIERAEVDGSLRMSTMERAAVALESKFLYVVLPDDPLEDLVFRQAYFKALEELWLPASAASGSASLGPETEEQLEIRTLELIDRLGLWGKGNHVAGARGDRG
jgi:transcriptional regulator with XRE-family HTH domain